MPTVCKITLDAEEYNRQLANVVERSRAAAAELAAAGGNSAPGLKLEVDTSEATAATDELAHKLTDIDGMAVSVSVDVADISAADDLAFALSSDLAGVSDVSPAIAVDASEVTTADDAALKLAADLRKISATNVSIKVDSSGLERASVTAKHCGNSIKGALKDAWAEATNLQGGFRRLWATIGAGGGAIGIIIAGIAAIGKIAAYVVDQARQKMRDLAESLQRSAESIREVAAANEELRQKSNGYMSRLGTLAGAEKLSNSQKAEAVRLIRELQKGYGDLGVSIDAATGRISGFDKAMLEKIRRDRQARIAEIDLELRKLKAQDKILEKEQEESGARLWLKVARENTKYMPPGSLAGIVGRGYDYVFDFAADQNLLRYIDIGGASQQSEAQEKRNKISDRINKLRKKRNTIKEDKNTENDFIAAQKAALDDLKQTARDRRREERDRRFDEDYSRLLSDGAFSAAAEVKNAQLKFARQGTGKWQKKVDAAQKAYDEAKDDIDRRSAQISLITLQGELNTAKAKELEINRQIAAAEQKAADAQGKGLEYAQKTAVAMTEARNGRTLTDDERGNVERLAKLEYELTHDHSRNASASELSIKSDALTKRGGFRSGAVVPDADRWSRLAVEQRKNTLTKLDEIKKLVTDLAPKNNDDDPGN